MDGLLTGTTAPGQSEPRNNSNEMVLHISQSSRTPASQSDGLGSLTGHSLGWVSYPSTEMQLAQSKAIADHVV